MKTKLSLLAAAVLPLLLASNSTADTATGASQANLLQGLSIIFSQDLDFGVILPPTDGDQITVSEATNSPSISAVGSSVLSGSFSRGLFDITGTPNTTTTVTVSDSATLTGPGDPMTVDNLVVNRSAPLMGDLGTTEIVVGGRLNVNPSQTPGDYTGTYEVTVAYY